MKYGELNLGQIEAMTNKHGGMDGVRKFLAGETVVRALEASDWKVWKTIQLGTGLKTADDFRRALREIGKISDWANDLLGRPAFTAASEEMSVDLVVVTVGELGFKEGATRQQIYDRALKLGLERCPAEVGPQLRLQYKDQPGGEWLLIGMEPLAGSVGDLGVFGVERGGGELWLISDYGHPVSSWSAGVRWVFRLPRK